ncbi:2OG-Fe(II) oxygenase [Mucilaginibacter glaciei]|uniref:2OG-Fe(II) oxygenase n=1 Tax=Mucilaginibacter glaciei TaxID=2772109 RepID=A0A926NXE1_9SPHI|nr:2OG-Fe(II) oxygenase [Mucilaginibacter glaciei]MBD1393583.1 2OG-Fe(II) oxygenase [Mucilaginibacter glaciei]
MEKTFSSFVDSYIDTQVGVSDHFLSIALSGHLKDNLLLLFADKLMHNAGTGNENLVALDKQVRGDSIYWLDRKHNDIYENAFFDLMDGFIEYLNRTCYTGITGYEFHYTLYEKGAFYKKHLDQFQNNGSRAYSMIMYLNTDWVQADGGELCIHHSDHLQHISPMNGKSVFFKSTDLEHEVLVTAKQRMSITGWLKVG